MKHIEKYKTKWHDTDASRKLRPSEILVYMQETANLQFQRHERDLDIERDKSGVAFILSKMILDFHKPLYAYEEIEVETWTCESRGFSFNRCFRILKGNEVVAEAFSVWALVDLKGGKLIRTDNYDVGFENEPAITPLSPVRIKMPRAEAFSKIGERKIVYSDIDYNMHMNNTQYPNMLCDFLEPNEIGRIRGMSLSYLHEAAFGDTLDILCTKVENDYYFKAVRQDGVVCLDAQVIC